MAELADLQERLAPPSALLAQAQPLTGVLYTARGPLDVAEALVVFEVGTVVYRFGSWAVTDDGIACLVHHYPLTRARLHEDQDWARHLAEQSWVNLWDVVRALAVAAQHSTPEHPGGGHGDGAHPG